MERYRYRDIFRIYVLIIGAFCVEFFVRYVLIGYISQGAAGAVICSMVLLVVLIIGVLILYSALYRFPELISIFGGGPRNQPGHYYAPVYPTVPAYYPPAYGQYPGPPAYQQTPVYQQPPNFRQPAGYPPIVYRQPAQDAPPLQGQPYQHPAAAGYYPPPYAYPPVVGYRPVDGYYPAPQGAMQARAPAPAYFEPPPVQAPVVPAAPVAPSQAVYGMDDDDRRPLSLPPANTLMWVFLAAVLVGGLSLALIFVFPIITGLVFPLAFIIGFSFPSLIWISYVTKFHNFAPLPGKPILLAFTFGMLSTIPAMLVNTAASLSTGADLEGASLAIQLAVVAGVAPFVEEFCKPWGVYLVKNHVKGRLDGLIYGVTCGVGFALIENISYEASFLMSGEGMAAVWAIGALARGLGSIVVHAVGAGFIGYTYGRLRKGRGSILTLVLAYLLAILFHAAWNGMSVLSSGFYGGWFVELVFMGSFAFLGFLLVRYYVSHAAEKDAGTALNAGSRDSH